MKTKVYVIFFLFLSSCDFLGDRSLDGVYRINEWVLILNKDHTFVLDKKFPYPMTCGTNMYWKAEPELRREFQKLDTLKGTYSIKDSLFIFRKIYNITTLVLHDYEHDSLFLKAYRDSLQSYTLKKEEAYNRTKTIRKKNEKQTKNTLDFSVNPVIPYHVYFNYPKPTPEFLSYKKDTTYYESPPKVINYLQNEYFIDSLEDKKLKYIWSGALDPGFIKPQNLNKDFFFNSLNKKNTDPINCKFSISSNYYINSSGKMDSVSVHFNSTNCSYALEKQSKEILNKIENWPKATFYGKPIGYSEFNYYYSK